MNTKRNTLTDGPNEKRKSSSKESAGNKSNTADAVEQIKQALKNNEIEIDGSPLSEDQKSAALELFDVFSKNLQSVHDPEFLEDGTLKLQLMKGGEIVLIPAVGRHIMQAKREMLAKSEKGDHNEMLSYYAMAACSTIDGKPATMFDIEDRLSARDFSLLSTYFRRVNLL